MLAKKIKDLADSRHEYLTSLECQALSLYRKIENAAHKGQYEILVTNLNEFGHGQELSEYFESEGFHFNRFRSSPGVEFVYIGWSNA